MAIIAEKNKHIKSDVFNFILTSSVYVCNILYFYSQKQKLSTQYFRFINNTYIYIGTSYMKVIA